MKVSDDFQAPGLDLFRFPPLWPGAPYWLTKPTLMAAYVLLIPLELLQNFVTSLFTHMLRLAANMFAGHLILAFFSAVGFWFLFEWPTLLGVPVGVLGVVMAIVMTGFEMFIQFLQAYLFVLLTAMFIGASLNPEH